MQFRKKPVVINAWPVRQLIAQAAMNWQHLPSAVRDAYDSHVPGVGIVFTDSKMFVRTLEGEMTAEIDDMLIRGVKGEFYPCKPDIFAATYEQVED